MKYQKAMVTIINLGNEDILTCSGYEKSYNWPTCPTNNNNNKNQKGGGGFFGWGWGWGWGGWWPFG